MRPKTRRRGSFMCRLNTRRRKLLADDGSRDHRAAMAMFAPER
jgi:hypothetical protein